jgi:hypothetical protein
LGNGYTSICVNGMGITLGYKMGEREEVIWE